MTITNAQDPRTETAQQVRLLTRFGPGLISGAADDDPGGIATYSQAGAQLGPSILGQVILMHPLVASIQMVAARIGRVTGKGLAANLLRVFPRPVVVGLVALLFLANTVNIGADLAAMGAAARLLTGLNQHIFTFGLAFLSIGLQIFVPYHRYVKFLKWMTLALFAYVGVVFAVRIQWADIVRAMVLPDLPMTASTLTLVVALFGTTISPYLFFWQSSEEVEDDEADPSTGPLITHPQDAHAQLNRIAWDTHLGMGFAGLIAFFIILTTSVTLHAAGITDIQTSAEAAEALRPIAGDFAFLLFSLGIVGTGLLATPVLAGSVAYAVCETNNWTFGLEKKANEAPRFYGIIAAAVATGLAISYSPLDPIKALFWSAVLNGLISVPIMAAMMIVATRKEEMGPYVATTFQRFFGWAATILMGAAGAVMLVLLMGRHR